MTTEAVTEYVHGRDGEMRRLVKAYLVSDVNWEKVILFDIK